MRLIYWISFCFLLLGCSATSRQGQLTLKGDSAPIQDKTVIKRSNFVPPTPSLKENQDYLHCLKRHVVDLSKEVTESQGYGQLTVYSLLNDTLAIEISTDERMFRGERFYNQPSKVLNKCALDRLDESNNDAFIKEIKLYVFESKVSLKDIMPNCYLTKLPKHKAIFASSGSVMTATSGKVQQRYMNDYQGGWKIDFANGGFLCSMYLQNVTFESEDNSFVLDEHLILDVYAGWYAG